MKNKCEYCQQGKHFNSLAVTADIETHNHIFGNQLRSVLYNSWSNTETISFKQITNCPFCGKNVYELPDEEMEEEVEE